MSDMIMCTPRTLPPGADAVKAAKNAVDINPRNQSPLYALADSIPNRLPPTQEELAVTTQKYWGAEGIRLSVSFLDSPGADLRKRIVSHMNAWDKTANVKFVESTDIYGADVRINRERMDDDDWNGYWSFLGTDIKIYEGPNKQTMNLQGFTMNTPESEFIRVVRHEAGHTMGFPHEHMREELVHKIDRKKAIAYYKRVSGWSEDDVVSQVLTPLNNDSLIRTEIADPNSIMAYQIPGSITKDGNPIPGGLDISELDYEFARLIYPQQPHVHA